MSDQWYYKQGEQEFGPVSLLEVRRMLDESILRPTDLVRKQDDFRWQSISNVLVRYPIVDAAAADPSGEIHSVPSATAAQEPCELHSSRSKNYERHATAGDESGHEVQAELLADLLAQAEDVTVTLDDAVTEEFTGDDVPTDELVVDIHKQPTREPGRSDASEAPLQERPESEEAAPRAAEITFATETAKSVAELAARQRLQSQRDVATDRRRTPRLSMPDWSRMEMPHPGLLVAAGFVLLLAILMFLPSLFATSTEAYAAQLFALRQEYYELRERQASDAEWDEFAARSTPQLATLVEQLEDTAHAGDDDGRARQALLFAARDFLPAMLREVHTNSDAPDRQLEELFDMQLSEAVRLGNLTAPEGFQLRASAEEVHAHQHGLEGDHDHGPHSH